MRGTWDKTSEKLLLFMVLNMSLAGPGQTLIKNKGCTIFEILFTSLFFPGSNWAKTRCFYSRYILTALLWAWHIRGLKTSISEESKTKQRKRMCLFVCVYKCLLFRFVCFYLLRPGSYYVALAIL